MLGLFFSPSYGVWIDYGVSSSGCKIGKVNSVQEFFATWKQNKTKKLNLLVKSGLRVWIKRSKPSSMNRIRSNFPCFHRQKSHCLYLILNTKDTSHFYWHQFWDKNDGENICHWNYFQIPRALSELPANWPGPTSLFRMSQNEIQAVWNVSMIN